MKLLYKTTDFNKTLQLVSELNSSYNKSVIFHCYWNGNLNEKHLYSILSCYFFNVYKNKHKIILWLENNIPNNFNKEISKYCEIKNFSLQNEKNKTDFLKNYNCNFNNITFYSDLARILLLYNYGGCWFDLDCFFLRNFDPIFKHFEKDISVYQWENENYPNNAIFISLEPKSIKMKNNINYIKNRNKGWGFQEAHLTYDLPLDMLVLPCSWFDGDWINNSYNIGTTNFFKNTDKKYNFDNFFKGSFCYHWHNKWNVQIEEKSIIKQLVNIIISKL
jgi:hypothetical protein